jgi:hypothetical protein
MNQFYCYSGADWRWDESTPTIRIQEGKINYGGALYLHEDAARTLHWNFRDAPAKKFRPFLASLSESDKLRVNRVPLR